MTTNIDTGDRGCRSCMHRYDDSDGPEYGPPAWACAKYPSRSNLKSFPFRRAQECHEPYPPVTEDDWALVEAAHKGTKESGR